MTQRKPVAQDWESWVEKQLRESLEAQNLGSAAGHGRPLPEIDAPYDPAWWTKKLMRREGVSDVPPALAMRRRVEAELARLMSRHDEDEVRRGLEELDREIRRLNATVITGPSTSVAPLDIDVLLKRWRDHRDRRDGED